MISENNSLRSDPSFRDPSGFVFKKNSQTYRQINLCYKKDYDFFIKSGLYDRLTREGLIVSHTEVKLPRQGSGASSLTLRERNPAPRAYQPGARAIRQRSGALWCGVGRKGDIRNAGYKIIRPVQIPFITYPFEWCFSQLKDAARLTLKIQEIALEHGMSLKDASAYNVQFIGAKSIFVDTLSFEIYQKNKPWIAYRQFCQHFLAPLALMSYVSPNLNFLSQIYIDGIPLDLVSKLLPIRTRFSLGLSAHIHLHALGQKKIKQGVRRRYSLSRNRLLSIVDSLKSTIGRLKLKTQETLWSRYYENINYTKTAFASKQKIVREWILKCQPKSVWDVGANEGNFSRLASQNNILTISTDSDHLAIEHSYLKAKREKESWIYPLIIDLTNPSAGIGWANGERTSFLNRCKTDLILCLALIHHLVIAQNIPLSDIAKLFSAQAKNLIIEFVPKQDSKTKLLLANREDIFANYNQSAFENEFSRYFKVIKKAPIKGSGRILYLMERSAR